jgi:hypothetical protein
LIAAGKSAQRKANDRKRNHGLGGLDAALIVHRHTILVDQPGAF